MIDRSISIHLQDFPNVDFIDAEAELIKDMDLVRSICSTALAIRDNKNLRVRLPLQSLTIIGKDAQRILPFSEIIAEEVNIKEIKIVEEISQFAENKLQINFKKIGAKFGAKIKEITNAIKEGNWQKINDKTIQIAGADSSITFASQIINNIGLEPKVIGAAFNKAFQSKPSPLIDGTTGVFIIKINSLGTKLAPTPDIMAQQAQSRLAAIRSLNSGWYEGLKKQADIVDDRFSQY